MLEATFNFPRGFLWGAATSAHQVEGFNTNNQWWKWEQVPGRISNNDRSDAACSWWSGRWREDFDRAAECGLNALRFSIEWSRVQPTSTHWDETAIDRYRDMARGLQARGLTALVTLHHFSDPLWLADEGGWENSQVINHFSTYARKMADSLKGYVRLWVTINEPGMYAGNSILYGLHPPGEKSIWKAGRVLENMVRAHAAAYRAIKDVQPAARVGVAHHAQGRTQKQSRPPLEKVISQFAGRQLNSTFSNCLDDGTFQYLLHRVHIPEAAGTQDFFGLSISAEELVPSDHADVVASKKQTRSRGGPGGTSQDRLFLNGFKHAIEWGKQYNLPIIITGDGIHDEDDSLRPSLLLSHLHQVWRAITLSARIEGYFHWSLVDSFEWHNGWSRRCGLWALDVGTQKRSKRVSADLYTEICKSNAITGKMVNRYAQEQAEDLFPE